MWLVDILSGSPLELDNMECREKDSVDDHARNVHSEILKVSIVTTISELAINIHQRVDVHGISTVTEDPETEELDSEQLVAVLQFLSFGCVGGDCVLAGGACWGSCRSVTPGDVVEVAHGVDLQNVSEGGQQKNVTNHTDEVGLGVVNEVKRSHHDWYKVNAEHDGSAEGENLEMVPVIFFPEVLGV